MSEEIRVIHGDCLQMLPTLEAGSVDCIVTDPPYGIGYDTPNGASRSRKRDTSTVIDWGAIEGDTTPDGRWLAEAFRVLKEGSALYLCTRWDVEPRWREMLSAAGFRVIQRLTWHKRDHGKGDLKGTYAATCEDVLFASKGRHLLRKRPPSLLDVGCVPTWERRHHPHQKPVALPRLLIGASTIPGDLILDPFAGSGTTLEAAMKSGRRAIGIETEVRYIPVINRRLEAAATPLFAEAR